MTSDYDDRSRSRRDDEQRSSTRRRSTSRSSSGGTRRSSDAQRSSQTRRSASDRERTSTRRSSTRRPAEGSSSTRRSSERRSASSAQRSSGERRTTRRPSSERQGTRRPSSQRQKSAARRQGSSARRQTTRRPASRQTTQNGFMAAVGNVGRKVGGFFSSIELPKLPLPAYGVIALLLVLLLHHFFRLGIVVNGTKATVWRGTTIEKLLDKGLADPKPGNLLAVDESVLTEGGGDRCTATINGEKAKIDSKVVRGADISITDGGDVTEDFTSSEETIVHGTSDSSREFDAYWAGSIHLLSDGQDGMRTVRTGKQSGITVSEVTVPAIDAGYITYTAKPEDKVIALTFDDGPWPETTSQILDVLEENGAKATFFTIGSQIADEKDQVLRASQMGCEVCTHSWDHAAGSGEGVNLTYMSSDEQIEEIQKGYASIKEVLGVEPAHVIRAPGGNFFGSIIDTLWPYVDAEIGWDVDTEDWRLPGSDAIAEMILSVEPGQVILMHDGGGDRSETVEALRIALPQLKEEGYSFVTVSELLAYGLPQAGNSESAGASTGEINDVG